MSQYLRFLAGPHELLLPVQDIVEVGDAGGASATSTVTGWRLWRERSLSVVNLPRYLGGSAGVRAQQIVLRDEAGGLSIIDVDQVQGIVELDERDFTGIAELSPALASLVDAVALADADTRCLLRLRRPPAWRDPLPVAAPAEFPDLEVPK